MHEFTPFSERLSFSRRRFTGWVTAIIGVLLLKGFLGVAYAYRRLRFFPIRSIEGTQRFDPDSWRLRVEGLVENEKEFTYQEILQLPRMTQIKNFVCVEGWGLDHLKWEGFLLKHILDRVRVKPEAKYVTFHAMGGKYSDSLTLAEALESETMLAYKLNDEFLRPEQGRPLRLIIPRMYAYKSVKWVERITFAKERHLGYWEKRGYPVDASIE